jgi:phosphate transport system protein
MQLRKNGDLSRRSRRAKTYTSHNELTKMTLKACLIARDAISNMRELLTNPSRIAFLAIRDCEKELDHIERHIDEYLPDAITQVNESQARQLLACLKFITDLERIGDLVLGVAQRLQFHSASFPQRDVDGLAQMATVLYEMLDLIHEGFTSLDLKSATRVLRSDAEVDRICHALFKKHLADTSARRSPLSFEILLMAQALERAGDHAKNLAEELVGLIEGHTARHPPKRAPAL